MVGFLKIQALWRPEGKPNPSRAGVKREGRMYCIARFNFSLRHSLRFLRLWTTGEFHKQLFLSVLQRWNQRIGDSSRKVNGWEVEEEIRRQKCDSIAWWKEPLWVTWRDGRSNPSPKWCSNSHHADSSPYLCGWKSLQQEWGFDENPKHFSKF